MSQTVLIDQRWAGDTGIGRLYKEVMERMPTCVMPSFINSTMSLGSPLTPFMLTKAIARSSAALFYSPSFMPPLFSKIPFVITIHDLMHLYYYSTVHRLYFKQVIGHLARKAKQVITVSHYSKLELIKHLGINENRIKVIYNGVDPIFENNAEHYLIERPYFLYIGNRRKNKNIPAMMEAFAKARIPKEVMFAISGVSDAALQEVIVKYRLEHRIKFLGYIPEEELPKVYKGAFATLYVSLMEGFGLPIIESMASGTPVITANTSSLPEIAGNAALCIQPDKIAAIAEAIEQLYHNRVLYKQLVDAGYLRARDFQWEATAKQTWETLLA